MNKFSHRIIVPEIIDDFNLEGNRLTQNLEEIEWINKYLGGTRASAHPVFLYIQKNLQKDITIADIGCGSGDLLKKIQIACKGVKKINLVGVDANPHIIEFARQRHFKNDPILWIHADIMSQPEKIPAADVYMLNLFLHHFEEKEIFTLLNHLLAKKPSLIVINDLERNRMAYLLFSLLCWIKNASSVTFHDGRLSILKGFNKADMKKIAQAADGYNYQLKWQWAFRWQLILLRN